MSLDIQIPYRGSDYLFSGISNAGAGIGAGIEQMGMQLKKAKAYRAMAIDALGMDKDAVDKMSLPELEGHFQAVAVKNQMESTRAMALERQAKAQHLQELTDEAQAWPEFARQLMAGAAAPGVPGGGGNVPAGGAMDPDEAAAAAGGGDAAPAMTAGTGTAPAPGAAIAGRFSPEAIMGAMSRMGKTNPKLASAMSRVLIPQLMQGAAATGPQSWTSPEGNPYVFMGHTLMPDRSGFNAGDMMSTTPEGYTPVQTGNNRVQYLKTEKELPSTFNSTMDKVQEDIASAEATLGQPDTAFRNADEAKTMRGYAQKRLDSARARGRATVDRYHSTRFLTDTQRDDMYTQLGLAPPAGKAAPAAPAAAPGPEERVTVKDSKGNKYTLPKKHLKDAIAQGYTQVQ